MKFCPYCGADLLDSDALFCANCGKKLPPHEAGITEPLTEEKRPEPVTPPEKERSSILKCSSELKLKSNNNKKILVVDDDNTLLSVIYSMFNKLEIKCDICHSSVEFEAPAKTLT